MKNKTNKWYLLPGMGATSKMYEQLLMELKFEINFLDWPKYTGEKTYLATAERIIEENDIKDGDIVGGSSLGGMIATEIAQRRQLQAVVLIGSAVSAVEVQTILSLLAPLTALTPISLIQLLVGKNDNIITKMFAETDSAFIRAMCQYLPKWQGAGTLPVSLFRLHGQKDHIIPCPKTGAEIIPDAGHLLALTHARKCGEYLNRINMELFN